MRMTREVVFFKNYTENDGNAEVHYKCCKYMEVNNYYDFRNNKFFKKINYSTI